MTIPVVRKKPLLALHPTEREEISWGLTEQLSVNQFVVGSSDLQLSI
jgi:hypothetical protein